MKGLCKYSTGKQPDLQPPLALGASLFALKGRTGEGNYYWQPGKNLSRKEEHTYFPSRAPSSSCWQMQPLEFSFFVLLLSLSWKSQFHWHWGQTYSAVSLKQECPRDYICRVSHTDMNLKLACPPALPLSDLPDQYYSISSKINVSTKDSAVLGTSPQMVSNITIKVW